MRLLPGAISQPIRPRGHSDRIIELEHSHGYASFRRQPFHFYAIRRPPEVRRPQLCTRVEERRNGARCRVDALNSVSLRSMASTTGSPEIRPDGRAILAFRHDVIDMEAIPEPRFWRKTVAAHTISIFQHLFAEDGGDRRLAHAPDSTVLISQPRCRSKATARLFR